MSLSSRRWSRDSDILSNLPMKSKLGMEGHSKVQDQISESIVFNTMFFSISSWYRNKFPRFYDLKQKKCVLWIPKSGLPCCSVGHRGNFLLFSAFRCPHLLTHGYFLFFKASSFVSLNVLSRLANLLPKNCCEYM